MNARTIIVAVNMQGAKDKPKCVAVHGWRKHDCRDRKVYEKEGWVGSCSSIMAILGGV